jgi:hypothetical protein
LQRLLSIARRSPLSFRATRKTRIMQCPRCKTHDVYVSRSANQNVFSFLWVAARCHRCCLLFNVPRWKHVPERPNTDGAESEAPRRAA